MNFVELIEGFIRQTREISLPSFLPELILTGTIVAMLLLRIASWNRITERAAQVLAAWLPLVGACLALAATTPWFYLSDSPPADLPNLGNVGQELFGGMLIYDPLTIYFRSFLLLFVVLFVIFTQLSGIPDREDAADFYTLILGSTIGMCLMASANHLLIVFLGVEMASVPSYALAGMLKGRRQASEAALKYAVYGAGAAGVMLYGISLWCGVLGTAHLPTLAVRLGEMLQAGTYTDRYAALVLGGLMIMVGLAFKLSAVPFHFWCPDVFEGASAEVNAFLSVASKGAAVALLLRVGLGIGYVPTSVPLAPATTSAARVDNGQHTKLAAATSEARATARLISSAKVSAAADKRQALNDALSPVRSFAAWLVAAVAAITCTFGNLAAYGQTNIKRLLAYSTIAHAGYLMMAVVPVLSQASLTSADASRQAVLGIAFYIGAYLFMNLAAFAIVAFLRNTFHSEEIATYGGLVRTSPGVTVCFIIVLLSLIGIPPMAGFLAKVLIFYPLVEGGHYTLLLIGGLNTVLSLFYYLRVIKVMTLDPEPEDRLPAHFSLVSLPGVYLVAITLPVVILGVAAGGLLEMAKAAAARLLT
ncbi:MAG: NADH-quinone oxidoreductase subunit N [Pirellulales bacterium]|nr:NADH-quinone oxidoreductase subunit N [Pirellulales bacterium]